jgi:adenosine/AMP kinase
MFNNLIVIGSSKIIKYINKLDLDIILTKPQLRHVIAFISAMVLKGYNGKVSDVSDLTAHRHRTCIGYFLNKSPWEEKLVLKSLKEHVIESMWRISKTTGNPIYVIIDDTISEKTVPSSKAKNPTEKCSFHRSHLKNQTVYGHQLVTVMLRCGNIVLPYAIVIYDKTIMSKIKIATEVINTLPFPVSKGYILCDSWYSCKAIFDASKQRGYTYVGALRTNRVIYPKGHISLGIKVNAFAKTLTENDVSLVKAGNHEYYQYTYQGKLNDLKEAKIVLSWPKDALFNENALKAFICLDTSISTEDILNHYVHRWPIEIFFRESKRYLGLDDYQVRGERSIRRYFILLMLTYAYCGLEVSGNTLNFSSGLKHARMETKQYQIEWIYHQAQSGVPFEQVLKTLKAS